jgi:hypothetical protein
MRDILQVQSSGIFSGAMRAIYRDILLIKHGWCPLSFSTDKFPRRNGCRFASPAGGTCYWKSTPLYSCEARDPFFQRFCSCDTPDGVAAAAAAVAAAAGGGSAAQAQAGALGS